MSPHPEVDCSEAEGLIERSWVEGLEPGAAAALAAHLATCDRCRSLDRRGRDLGTALTAAAAAAPALPPPALARLEGELDRLVGRPAAHPRPAPARSRSPHTRPSHLVLGLMTAAALVLILVASPGTRPLVAPPAATTAVWLLASGRAAPPRVVASDGDLLLRRRDGLVSLDLSSSAALSVGSAERVELAHGTLVCTVEPDRDVSFAVVAGPCTVRVTGTAFRVSRFGGGVEIEVRAGRVRVETAHSTWSSFPGSGVLRLDDSGRRRKPPPGVRPPHPWTPPTPPPSPEALSGRHEDDFGFQGGGR